jgi:hypothetical protein
MLEELELAAAVGRVASEYADPCLRDVAAIINGMQKAMVPKDALPPIKDGTPCIYGLWRTHELIYVGLSRKVRTRLIGHRSGAYYGANTKAMDSYSVVEVPAGSLELAETRIIKTVQPPLNGKAKGETLLGFASLDDISMATGIPRRNVYHAAVACKVPQYSTKRGFSLLYEVRPLLSAMRDCNFFSIKC